MVVFKVILNGYNQPNRRGYLKKRIGIIVLILGSLINTACSTKDVSMNHNKTWVETRWYRAETITLKQLQEFFRAYFDTYSEETMENKATRKEETLPYADTNGIFDLPRRILIGENVIGKTKTIQQVELEGIQGVGEDNIYYISVVTTNDCISKEDFEKLYQWNRQKECYETTGGINSVPHQDEICIKRKYWMHITKEKPSPTVKMLCESHPLQIDKRYCNQVDWNQNISQMPYPNELNEVQKTKIRQAITNELKSQQSTRSHFDPINLKNQVCESEQMQIESTWGSTKLKPKFKVNVPVKVLLNNNEVIYYHYNYLVELGQNAVPKISFIGNEEANIYPVRQLKLTE